MDTLFPSKPTADSTSSYDYHSLYDGSAPWSRRLKAVPVVFLHRLRRGGLAFYLRIAAGILGLLILFKLFSPGLGDRYRNVLSWSSKKPAEGKDLRLVVFGSQDILGSSVDAASGDGTTWPERLCMELDCDALMSLVPTSEFQPGLTSNAVYNTELQALLKLAEESNITDKPAADLYFVSEQYPVPAQTPDLATQVQQFLSMPPPAQSPRETLWIFTFGTWDIWKAAAMPKESGEKVVDEAVRGIFEQVELLYQESLNQDSIAFSDFWSNATKQEVSELTDPNALESVDQRRLESFRIIVPELLDLSLAPGWNSRPQPPFPHSIAEQLRNSAVLTARWNSAIRSQLDAWSGKGSNRPEGTEGNDVQTDAKPIPVPKADTVLEYLPFSAQPSSQDENDKTVYAPYPRRRAYRSEPAKRVLEAIVEEDMRRIGAKDGLGRGSLGDEEPMRFHDVWTACEGGKPSSAQVAWGDSACNKPEDHLFSQGFTLSPRAVEQLVARTAEGVRETLLKRN